MPLKKTNRFLARIGKKDRDLSIEQSNFRK